MFEEENKKLRELLWIRHGCSLSSLYGDDGEMHCNACMIDFKRASAFDIEQMFRKLSLQRYTIEVSNAAVLNNTAD